MLNKNPSVALLLNISDSFFFTFFMCLVSVTELEPLTEEEISHLDSIDMVKFWHDREKESIARGFIRRELLFIQRRMK